MGLGEEEDFPIEGKARRKETFFKRPQNTKLVLELYLSTAALLPPARSSKLLVRRCTAVVEGAFSRTNG